VLPRDEHLEPATERIGGDPCFVWRADGLAASDDSDFDAFASAAPISSPSMPPWPG
jgi:hypothetical protein